MKSSLHVNERIYKLFFAFSIKLIALMFICTGCGSIDRVADSVDNAVQVIDRGIDDIQSESASWQTVLQRVANELPKDISSTIRNDAQNLATRAIATTGSELRCNIDFLGDRAIAALQMLKAKLLGKKVTPLPPQFCQVAPDGIELSADPNSWARVTLFGYDLDHQDDQEQKFKVYLLDNQGRKTQLEENRIGRTTHYQTTLNLGGLARQFYQNNIVKLQVAWNKSTNSLPEIVVVPWQPKRRTEIKNMERTSFMPPHVRGDREFDSHDDEHMSVDVRGELNITDRFIDSRVFMNAREERPDWTQVEGWTNWERAYTAPENWKIVEVRPRSNSHHKANINDHGKKIYSRPAGEVVSHFDVWGDHGGDEAGTWTQVEVYWRPIEVTLVEMSPEWLQ